MTLDTLINDNYENLNSNDLHILQFVQANIPACADMSIADLALQCNVSPASVLRTTKKLKFSGFSEFKYFLKRDNKPQPRSRVRYMVEDLNADIEQTIKMIGQNNACQKLYKMMDEANCLYAYGTGHGQRLMINEFARCMLNVNKNIVILPASTELEIAANHFKPNDLLFIASLSGNIASLKNTLTRLDIRQIPIVSITNLQNNALASFTKYNFYYQTSHIGSESKLNQSSFVTLHLLFHLLYEGYVEYLLEKENPQE